MFAFLLVLALLSSIAAAVFGGECSSQQPLSPTYNALILQLSAHVTGIWTSKQASVSVGVVVVM